MILSGMRLKKKTVVNQTLDKAHFELSTFSKNYFFQRLLLLEI